MRWQDNAILLTVRKTDKAKVIIEAFCQHHGRYFGTLNLDGGKAPALMPGSRLEVEWEGETSKRIGEYTIHATAGGVVANKKSDIGFLALTTINFMLAKLLPEREPFHYLYENSVNVIDSLSKEDGLWPVEYSRWEFALLATLGYVEGLSRCISAYKHGETVFISPKSGRVATRQEVGAFMDKMLPVPGYMLGNSRATVTEVRQALRMTKMFLEKFAFGPAKVEAMPECRMELIAHIASIRDLPKPKERALGMEAEESRAKRMDAIDNPLLVGTRI